MLIFFLFLIFRLIVQGHGRDVVSLVKKISLQGRACKHDTTIYALATCAKSNDRITKKEAYIALPDVCRTPTHLFQFIKYIKEIAEHSSGWGRSARVGISKWYKSFTSDDPNNRKSGHKLAYLVTKYNRRHSWTHRDVIRMAHLKKPRHGDFRLIIEYLNSKTITDNKGNVSDFLKAVDRAKGLRLSSRWPEEEKQKAIKEVKKLIAKYQLAREHIPTEFLNYLNIWQVLFNVPMPFTAMLRSLGKMTSLGMFDSTCTDQADSNIEVLNAKLEEVNTLSPKCPKIHPLTLLIALQHYQLGRSTHNENLRWVPDQRIVTALTSAFESQTKILPSTEKSYLIAMSVGEDMQNKICGSSITASKAAAAMILSTVRTENVEVLMFANSIEESYTRSISRDDTLDSIQTKIDQVSNATRSQDGTISEDLCVPFKWAAARKTKFDVIIIFTSSLSSGGYVHPAEMLKMYLEHVAVKDYRLIVVGMCDNKYSVASPIDMNALDVVGFDLHVPTVIRDFVSGFEGDKFTNAVHPLSELEEMGNLTIYDSDDGE